MEYITVVPHYLIDNDVLIYYVRYNIWSRLLVPSDFDHKNRESLSVVSTIDTLYNYLPGYIN
jgi:hypothetical protein